MVFCPKCGAESPGGDRFCRACGGALLTGVAPSPVAIPTGDPASIGSLFADRYEVKRELGRGGMGIVYEALDRRLKDRIALKVLMPHHAANPTVYERFLQEVRTARQLSHPSIVKVYDLGEASRTVYFTMEYLEGRDLDEILEEEGPFAVETAVEILTKVCAALDCAHKASLVHRDVKPENIFMTLGGEIKVLDFGVAKVMDRSTTGMTGSMIGTPSYMAPEQVSQGGKVDYRTDIYALGVVAFRMMTGRLPFVSSDPIEAALQHIHALPPAPRTINPAIPPLVEDAILRALAKDPARRHPSTLALSDDLRHAAGLADEAPRLTIEISKGAAAAARPLPAPAAAPAPAADAGTAPNARARALTPGAPLFPAAPTARWAVISQGKILNDIDRPTIERWIGEHKLVATDHAKTDGGKWFPLESYPDFVDALGAVVPEDELPDIVPERIRQGVRRAVLLRAALWIALLAGMIGGYGWIRVWTKARALEAALRPALNKLYNDEDTIDLNGKPGHSAYYATTSERDAELTTLGQFQGLDIRADESVLEVDAQQMQLRWIVPFRVPVMFVPIRSQVTVETYFKLRERQLSHFYKQHGVKLIGTTDEQIGAWIAEREARSGPHAPPSTPPSAPPH